MANKMVQDALTPLYFPELELDVILIENQISLPSLVEYSTTLCFS